MGGSLVHSKTLRVTRWQSEEFGSHYEVGPDEDGDYDHFSYSRWGELKRYCADFGVPAEVWPDFTAYESCIDVPLDQIVAKQGPFRLAIESLPGEVIAGNRHPARIAVSLCDGEQAFIS